MGLIISLKDNCIIASKYQAHTCVSGTVQNAFHELSCLIITIIIQLLIHFADSKTELQASHPVSDSCLIP